MREFLDKRMLMLRNEIENEVKKVLGMNFLGMITDYLSNTKILGIFSTRLARFMSTFILLKKPVIEKKDDLYILHVSGCSKLDKVKKEFLTHVEEQEEGFEIPID